MALSPAWRQLYQSRSSGSDSSNIGENRSRKSWFIITTVVSLSCSKVIVGISQDFETFNKTSIRNFGIGSKIKRIQEAEEDRICKKFVTGEREPRSENSRRNLHTQKVVILIIIKST